MFHGNPIRCPNRFLARYFNKIQIERVAHKQTKVVLYITFLRTCASKCKWLVSWRLLWIQGSWNPREWDGWGVGAHCPYMFAAIEEKAKPERAKHTGYAPKTAHLQKSSQPYRRSRCPSRQDREEFGGRGEGGSWGTHSQFGASDVHHRGGESGSDWVTHWTHFPPAAQISEGRLLQVGEGGKGERQTRITKGTEGGWSLAISFGISRRLLSDLWESWLEDPPGGLWAPTTQRVLNPTSPNSAISYFKVLQCSPMQPGANAGKEVPETWDISLTSGNQRNGFEFQVLNCNKEIGYVLLQMGWQRYIAKHCEKKKKRKDTGISCGKEVKLILQQFSSEAWSIAIEVIIQKSY